MFETVARSRPQPLGRRAAALTLSLSQCGVLGGLLAVLPGLRHGSEELEDTVLPVLVEWSAPAPQGPAAPAPGPRSATKRSISTRPALEVAPVAVLPGPSSAPGLPAAGGGGGEPGPPGGGGGGTLPCIGCSTTGGPTHLTEALRPLTRIQPRYPAAALSLHLGEVTCDLLLQVDARGRVEEARISGCPEIFHAGSLSAAKRWRFSPHAVDGVAKPAVFSLRVRYRSSG